MQRRPEIRLFLALAGAVLAVSVAAAQKKPPLSPSETASGTIGGATITVKYSAPSVRGRQIFGPGGLVAKDKTAPIWRAGANAATAFHTDRDLDVGGLTVPKGDYTLFVDVQNPNAWILVINKQTGQWGLTYTPSMDLGRVKMEMATPPSLIERLKYKINDTAGNKGSLVLEWEHHTATVPITVK